MILLLATSLFFTQPVPLEMPRAEGYLVSDGDHRWLEDRFNRSDLWVSQSVDGRWVDDDDRVFILAHLETMPPPESAELSTVTRANHRRDAVAVDKRDLEAVRTALAAISPVKLAEKETRPRQLPRGYKDVDYWQGTNTSTIVCAYLREKESVWRAAIWHLAEQDDFDECLRIFEKEFFEQSDVHLGFYTPPVANKSAKSARQPADSPSERELLRSDARHAVAAYANWHTTDANEFSILDDLPDRALVISLTNELPVMRRAFADTIPTLIDTTNTLAVARIFADREEYLEALATDGITNMDWSAAYWSPRRRELVAYYSVSSLYSSSLSDFLATFRHESFHQYLSYATALTPVSPWLNEGYAQYFENESVDWKLDASSSRPSAEELERFSLVLPTLMMMDYDEFYAGSDFDRHLKYRLAWSIAVFIEKGAPEIRFQPYKKLKKNYFESLMKTKDMRQATENAFENADLRKKFVGDWLKYWKEH